MISIDEILSIQNISSSRSKEPGIPVIPRRKLANLIQSKINKTFNLKHLNIAVELYCRRGYGIRMNHGKKKYNLIAENVPKFLDWFFLELEKDLYSRIEKEFQRHFIQGMETIKKRKFSGRFLYILKKEGIIYKTNSLENFSKLHNVYWQSLYDLFNQKQTDHKGFTAVGKIRIKVNGKAELTTSPNTQSLEILRLIQKEKPSHP